VFGVLSPGNIIVNLMSANVTAAAASSSADLLTDLKLRNLAHGAYGRRISLSSDATGDQRQREG